MKELTQEQIERSFKRLLETTEREFSDFFVYLRPLGKMTEEQNYSINSNNIEKS